MDLVSEKMLYRLTVQHIVIKVCQKSHLMSITFNFHDINQPFRNPKKQNSVAIFVKFI